MKVDKKIIAATIVSSMLNMGAPHAMEAPIDKNKVAQISEKLSEMGLSELDNDLKMDLKHQFNANDEEINAALETVKHQEAARKFEEAEDIRRDRLIQIMREMGYQKLSAPTIAEIQSLYKAEHKETATGDEVMNAWKSKDMFKKVEKKVKEEPISQISENNPFVVLGIDNQELINKYKQYIQKHEDYEYNLSMDPNYVPHDIFVMSNDEVTQIKKQYKKQSMQYHPDKNKTPEAKEMFDKTLNAYKTLKSFAQFD